LFEEHLTTNHYKQKKMTEFMMREDDENMEREYGANAFSGGRVNGVKRLGARVPSVGVLALSVCMSGLAGLTFAEESEAEEPVLALSFGGSDYIETEVNAEDLGIDGNNARTVEAWAYTREFDDNGAIFSMGELGSNGRDFALRVQDSTDAWRVQYWGGSDIDFSHPSSHEWVHFAVVHTGERTIVYANGEEVANSGRSINTSADQPFRIGRWMNRSTGFKGEIVDVRVWDVARSKEDIQRDMNVELTGEEDGLVGYWPLNEGEGDVARDLAGGNDGAFVGNPEWILTRPFVESLPEEISVDPGDEVTLGPVELRQPKGEVKYQWYFNGEPIEGATEKKLSFSGITLDQLGTYTVEVDDDRGLTPVEASVVLPELDLGDLIKGELGPVTAKAGESVTMGPVELRSPQGEARYQWYLDGEPIEGATQSTYVIEEVTSEHRGSYHVEIDDDSEFLTPVESNQGRLWVW